MTDGVNGKLSDLLGRWVALCSRRAVPVLLIVGLLTLAAIFVSWRYGSIDSDLGKLIRPSDDVGWFRDNEAYKAAFPEQQRTAVVVVSGGRSTAVDASARRLVAALRAENEFEFVFAPALDDFFRRQRLFFLERTDLESWVEGVRYDYGVLLRLSDSADLLNAAFTLADQVSAIPGLPLQHPLASLTRSFETEPPELDFEAYPHLELQTDGDYYSLIVLKGQPELEQSLPDAELVALIREIIGKTPAEDGVRVRLTGEVVLANEEIGAALEGIGIAGTLSVVLLTLILWVGVRSFRTIVVILVMLAVGVALTLGYATLVVGSFNTLALIFVVMFFGLGVDFAVHYALRVREFGDGEDAAVVAARDISPALLMCVLTTSVGFLSFVPTAYLGLGELGIISAGGMVIAFILTLTVIPALYKLLGTPKSKGTSVGLQMAVTRLRPGIVLVATLGLSMVAFWFARDLRFDYSVLAMRDASTEAMSTLLELQNEGVATDYSIAVLVNDAESAVRLKSLLLTLDEVGTVQTPLDLVPGEQPEKRELIEPLIGLLDTLDAVLPGEVNNDLSESVKEAVTYLRSVQDKVPQEERPAFARFAEGISRLSQDPQAFARLGESLREALETELADLRSMVAAQPFEFGDLPADLRTRLVASDGRHLVTVQPAVALLTRQDTETFIQAVAGVAPNIAGRAVVEWGVGGVAVDSFIKAITLSITTIFLLLLVYFRDLFRPLLVLAPLALATLFSFAFMQVSGLTLNMANILVVPLIFGLGVDAGIHVVHRYSVTGSIRQIFESSTARAVLISALTTMGAFFSLSFSPHKGAASVGMLLFVAITLMLLATFVVLPALLKLAGNRLIKDRPLLS